MRIDKKLFSQPWFLLGALTLLLHLLANGGYGIFRDELYFIVCGRRLDWGYVDQPPLVPLLAAWSYALSGDWLTGFRLLPALALSTTVALTAAFTRALGGGKFAQWLAGLCAFGAPQFLAIGLLFTTDTFQALTWLGCAWCLLRLEQSKDERWWLAFGAIAGFGLLSKYLIGFYLVALALGLVATPLHRSLVKPWVYAGVALAAVVVLPNVLWQQAHGWPFLELGKAASNGKNIALSPLAFFFQQLLLVGPLAAPVWLAGLWACANRPRFALYRAFPIAYVVLFAFFVVSHGKAYYLTYFYPVLFGIGAVAIEGWVRKAVLRGVALVSLILATAVFTPVVIPLMPEESFIRYSNALGLGASATAAENRKQARLPQYLADMHGWPQMAAKIAAVYHALPPQDRAKAVFYGRNYGEAAAIDVYGARLGLPPAISSHNNYWLWGTRGHDGSVIIELGGDKADHEKDFRTVEWAGEVTDPYAMPDETDQAIWVERGLRKPLTEIWPKLKHYQ
ncbi:MAG: glycosyltransferase family 39 protein [Rhizomicrobium sp.]|nr:glycosyltransferase family 39 protein [Rhizomicrobium sp.]